jgi:hypothetical protein
MMKNSRLSTLTIILMLIAAVLPACTGQPATPETTTAPADWVSPDEGTIGTEFTITRSGFGEAKPTVHIGEANCTVLTYSDTTIRAVLADTLPSGTYDVKIEPGEGDKAAIIVKDAFTVMPPYISPMIPTHVAPLDQVIIKGSFFGSKAGEVSVIDQDGQAQNCDLVSWNMDSVTFTVPRELYGVYNLVAHNDVGTATQTRVLLAWTVLGADGEPPTNIAAGGATKTRDYNVGSGTPRTSATGIYYGGEFWVFFSGDDINLRTHSVQYRRLGYDKNGNQGWTESGRIAPGGKKDLQLSLYAPSPVIFEGDLYVFWVDKKTSTIKYSMYKGKDTSGEDAWYNPRTINVTPSGEVSPVYNPATSDIELYYMSDNKVYWMHTKDGMSWSNPFLIKGVQTSSPPTAEVVETGEGNFEIMLATRSVADDSIQITFTSLGKVIDTYPLINVYDENEREHTYCRPFLTNLGHGEVALFWRGTDDRVNVVYYDVDYEQFHDKYTWQEKGLWGKKDIYPTGAVGFEATEDALVATLWVFYDKTYGGIDDPKASIFSRTQQELGMWKHSSDKQYDWAQIEEKEIWDLYPVVGVIDMPPFLLNGNTTPDENKTMVTFEHGTERATTMEFDLQAGLYFKAQPALGLTGEVHAGITKQWSTETKVTAAIRYSLEAHAAPQIRVLYLAPVFQMIEYQWFDEAYQGTEDVIVVPVVKDASIIARLVDPSTDPNFNIPKFPIHEAGNLDTYRSMLDQSLYDTSASGSWDAGGPTNMSLTEQKTSLKGTGGYFHFEIGWNFAEWVGFGAEGEFDVKHTSSTTNMDSVVVILDNPPPSVAGDIKSFTTTVYWAKPNQNGYWVPLNKRGLGDEPWFITYSAEQIIPYE